MSAPHTSASCRVVTNTAHIYGRGAQITEFNPVRRCLAFLVHVLHFTSTDQHASQVTSKMCHQNGTLYHSSSAQNVDVNPKFSKHFRTPNLLVLSITTTVNLLRLKTFAVFVLLHKKFGGFYPASLFGQKPTFRDYLYVPSSGSQSKP